MALSYTMFCSTVRGPGSEMRRNVSAEFIPPSVLLPGPRSLALHPRRVADSLFASRLFVVIELLKSKFRFSFIKDDTDNSM